MEVIVNAAMSADGKLSSVRREQIDISGPADFDRVDGLRADADAVMVGIGTVLADDPHLTVKDPANVREREERGKPPHPARVIADSRARVPTDAAALDDLAATYALVTDAAPTDRIDAIERANAEVIRTGGDRVDLSAAFDRLAEHGIDRLLVEGGGELLYSVFDAGLVDTLSVYVGDLIIGGRNAPTLVDGEGFVDAFPELSLTDVERIDSGVLLTWAVSGSDRSPRRR